MTYSVHDEPDFARVYTEDDEVTVRRGDLRALLDVATGSMDFGSGFLDNEQVEILRKIGDLLGIDPLEVTPSNFVCQYGGTHRWYETQNPHAPYKWACHLCRHTSNETPPS